MQEALIKKYNILIPRYTSYPTFPYWDKRAPNEEKWSRTIKKVFNETNSRKGISVYIHLPYCEKLCTYCACMRYITKNHKVEQPYIDALIDEWRIYLRIFEDTPVLKELHLGGGTPTFFSPRHLHRLIDAILKSVSLHEKYEFSFEANPNSTTKEHLQVLYDLKFRRLSFGIQDFDPIIQKTVNRIISYERVKSRIEMARKMGYQSINIDLIYGLPKQQLSSIAYTFKHIEELKPDRIAFYSYAHVPWKSKSQQIFNKQDIPSNMKKRMLYEKGREKLQALGYHDIGLDHFALPQDDLYKATLEKRLHRNFMGYNTSSTELLIGLGVSSITDAKYAYAQNTKDILPYQRSVKNGRLLHIDGYFLTNEDRVLKKTILDISCKRELCWTAEIKTCMPKHSIERLNEMVKEGIIEFTQTGFQVTDFGMIFLRNICSVFDKKLFEHKSTEKLFSSSI